MMSSYSNMQMGMRKCSPSLSVVQKDGSSERVCFVEHNPEKAPGHQLHIGVYCSTEEDTVYYDSYVRTTEEVEDV